MLPGSTLRWSIIVSAGVGFLGRCKCVNPPVAVVIDKRPGMRAIFRHFEYLTRVDDWVDVPALPCPAEELPSLAPGP